MTPFERASQQMFGDKAQDITIIIILGVLAAGIGYIFFGILHSEASGLSLGMSLSGGIAGFVVVFALLASTYRQFQSSSRYVQDLKRQIEEQKEELTRAHELQQLREENKELQHKVIRGAPCPEGFLIEVSERQRIVLARPENWAPQGGMIFNMELPTKSPSKDVFAPTFQCYHLPVAAVTSGGKRSSSTIVDNEIKAVSDSVEMGFTESFTHETMTIGGEPHPVKCIKIIANQYAKVIWQAPDEMRRTGRRWIWFTIDRDEFIGNIEYVFPPEVVQQQPARLTIIGHGFTAQTKVLFNDEPKTTIFYSDTRVDVSLSADDLSTPGPAELSIHNPDRTDETSQPVNLQIRKKGEIPQQLAGEFLTQSEPGSEEGLEYEGTGLPGTEGETPDIDSASRSAPAQEPAAGTYFTRLTHMRVVCCHEGIRLSQRQGRPGAVFIFEFFDNTDDFQESSAIFNQVLKSVRFLE